MNAGLVLAADREDEVAGVLAHEISHVTQQHVLRGVEKAQRESLPILLAMLGAIVAAQQAGGTSSGDATSAALMTGLGVLQQRQINYTRDNEAEADRIGIRTLRACRLRPGGDGGLLPDPAVGGADEPGRRARRRARLPADPPADPDAHQRGARARRQAGTDAGQYRGHRAQQQPAAAAGPAHRHRRAQPPGPGQHRRFRLGARAPARAQRRHAGAGDPRIPADAARKAPLDEARSYGLAFAHQQAGQHAQALQELAPLAQARPDNLWVQIALGESEARTGHAQDADRRFEALLARMPTHRALALSYARLLGERNTREAGTRAVRRCCGRCWAGPATTCRSSRPIARANEIAGDPVRAGEAWAEAAYLSGRPEQALVQLNNLKKRDDLDYYARARIDARIAAITPTVLELRRQGVRDDEVRGGRLGFGIRAGR